MTTHNNKPEPGIPAMNADVMKDWAAAAAKAAEAQEAVTKAQEKVLQDSQDIILNAKLWETVDPNWQKDVTPLPDTSRFKKLATILRHILVLHGADIPVEGAFYQATSQYRQQVGDPHEWALDDHWFTSPDSPDATVGGILARCEYIVSYGQPRDWKDQMMAKSPLPYRKLIEVDTTWRGDLYQAMQQLSDPHALFSPAVQWVYGRRWKPIDNATQRIRRSAILAESGVPVDWMQQMLSVERKQHEETK